MGLPKEKRLVDPASTVKLSCIREGTAAEDIKKSIIPRQVMHVVDKVNEIEWTDEKVPPPPLCMSAPHAPETKNLG